MFGFISKLSSTGKIIFCVAILAVIIAMFDRMFIGPVTERIDLINVEIDQRKDTIVTEKKILSYQAQIDSEAAALDKYVTNTAPEDGVINGEILGKIERLSALTKVQLSKSKPSEVQKSDQHYKYIVDLECQGTLKELVTFMHAINASEELLKVISFKFSPNRGEEGEQIRASITISKLLVSTQLPKLTPQE